MIEQHIFTVTELTAKIKTLLEDHFAFVWISGEISNFIIPASGHYYFSLKDRDSQINAVMFRGQNRRLKFTPEDGQHIVGLGRIGVYPPRGTYQIILEQLEPRGIGALQIAFEQLKKKLAADGLFDAQHKRALPGLPRQIFVISSASGAVIHDIMQVAGRRFPNMPIVVVPTAVQGQDAEPQILRAFDNVSRYENADSRRDVIILARGGGSLEDLQAFNSEPVARAIFNSRLPVIAAIGHETDVTIADFTADVRAPTPSAAAELVTPRKSDMLHQIRINQLSLQRRALNAISVKRGQLDTQTRRLVHPRKRLDQLYLRLDELTQRLGRAMQHGCADSRRQSVFAIQRLLATCPARWIENHHSKLDEIKRNLHKSLTIIVKNKFTALQYMTMQLAAYNPQAILSRGYSITRDAHTGRIIQSAGQTHVGQALDVVLAKGRLHVTVDRNKESQ